MNTISNTSFRFNPRIRIGFDGGNLSSEGGLPLVMEFMTRIGFHAAIDSVMPASEDSAHPRMHSDAALVEQFILQMIAGCQTDTSADTLRHDPLLKTLTGREQLASQPAFSRFWNQSDGDTLQSVNELLMRLRSNVHTLSPARHGTIDLDTTLIETHGRQGGSAYNAHYRNKGYHPYAAFDGTTADLLKIELREGAKYCSNGAGVFITDLLEELAESTPGTTYDFRADSGFAAPEVYEALEADDCPYAIKLKHNFRLNHTVELCRAEARVIANPDFTKEIREYGEFQYQAAGWTKPRRVVFCVTRPMGTLFIDTQFIVTTMGLSPEETFDYYRGRGSAENFIKEFKNEFAHSLPHKTMETNAVRFAVQGLCYNLFNWFRRLCLSGGELQKASASTIRQKLLTVAVRVSRSSRYVHFHLSSCWPYRTNYERALLAVSQLPCI